MSISAVFFALFVTAGLGIAAFGSLSVIHAHVSSGWPHVSGEITRAKIDEGDDSYSPLVCYSYSVGGQLFTGNRIAFGLTGMSASYHFAHFYVQRYRVGLPVTVYYDPKQPSTSVLEPGVSKRAFIPMAFGLGFAVFGGWFVLLAWLFQPSSNEPVSRSDEATPRSGR